LIQTEPRPNVRNVVVGSGIMADRLSGGNAAIAQGLTDQGEHNNAKFQIKAASPRPSRLAEGALWKRKEKKARTAVGYHIGTPQSWSGV